ncbi:MAG: PstS family phosphate ABC transporter substrate-binding protein [Phycisphaerales bacterium]
MKKKFNASLLTSIAVLAVTGSATAQGNLSRLRGQISVDGSSTVYPITEAVAEEFGKLAPNVRVTVGISGTGGGFKRFAIGETDISDASRPIKDKEHQAAVENNVNYVEIPVAYDGLSIVVHPTNYWVDNLTVDELKKIFQDGSKVDSWDDVRAGWPNVPMKMFVPGADSGTFDYFKEVVAERDGSIRGDMSTSEDDNQLVRGVAGTDGAIGFFGFAYYEGNKDQVKIVPIINPATGKAVTPTNATIESGEYAPFSRPLFIYVNAASLRKPEIRAFVNFYLDKGAELAEEVGYVRLPQTITDRAKARALRSKTGSSFLDAKMKQVHGPLAEVYK